MKLEIHNPAAIVQPASRYSQGVSVDGAQRWLLISGQVGASPAGEVAADARAQTRRCFDNIEGVLQDAGMGVGNLVKITAFVTSVDHVATFREVRDEVMDGHLCASTLLVVDALANAHWMVEIEAVAAG
jgi:enamine deaminase RidA (YjgF/YER057c/UK114 family)